MASADLLRATAQHDLEAVLGRDLGDAGAHDPRTHDPDALDRHLAPLRPAHPGRAGRLPTSSAGRPNSNAARHRAGRLVGSAPVAGPRKTNGTLALLGGGEWQDECRDLDRALLAMSGGERGPRAADRRRVRASGTGRRARDRVVRDARRQGRRPRGVNRRDAENDAIAKLARDATFVYVADGSPLHLRSVLKDSALYDAMLRAYAGGAVVAASGAGATLLCDPMVDPRGGAYTVGLGLVRGLAVFPYHGTRRRPPARTVRRAAAERRGARRPRRAHRARARCIGWMACRRTRHRDRLPQG